jgi:CO/xanthine dehydrogenase Mo-binding subunit
VNDGGLFVDGARVADVADLLDSPIEVSLTYHHPPTTAFDDRGQGNIHSMFVFAAERAVVDVDVELGLARVVQIAAVQDVGNAINPRGVEGQIEGATAQGVGLALTEEIVVEDGIIRNGSFTDYLIPTFLDMPDVVSGIVEDPEPGVPLGIKGAGEQAMVVAPAAVAAALRNATGRELNRIPVKPDDLAGLVPPRPATDPPPRPEVPGNRSLPYYQS